MIKNDSLIKLLNQTVVERQVDIEKEIIKFSHFEFAKNPSYQPILLRILLNSINIYNLLYNTSHEKDFPIGIKYLICGDGKKIMIMYTKNDSDILSDALNNGLSIFNDAKDIIDLNKIDINFEYCGEDKHIKYITGLDFEKNSINQLLSNIKENIKVLPNIMFYIDEKFHEILADKLKLTPKAIINSLTPTEIPRVSYHTRQIVETEVKKYTGFNELDLVIKVEKDFPFNVKDFTLVNIFKNGKNQLIPDKLEFKQNKIYIFEFKINSFKVDNSIAVKTYNKGTILLNSIFQNEQNKDFIIIIAMNHNKDKTKSFIEKLDNKNIDTIYGFHVDIAVKFSIMLNINIKINQLQDKMNKMKKENDTAINNLREENKKQLQEYESKLQIEKEEYENKLQIEKEENKKQLQIEKEENKKQLQEYKKKLQIEKEEYENKLQIEKEENKKQLQEYENKLQIEKEENEKRFKFLLEKFEKLEKNNFIQSEEKKILKENKYLSEYELSSIFKKELGDNYQENEETYKKIISQIIEKLKEKDYYL